MTSLIGHNRLGGRIRVQVRLFNSLTHYAGGGDIHQDHDFEAGATVGDVAASLGLPMSEVFLVLVNGRDVSSGLVGDPVEAGHMLEDRDVVAFSGAVPFSYGYGAPVV